MILKADARSLPLRDRSVNCCVTSPPYWGLRDYGLEPSIWMIPGRPECRHVWDALRTARPNSGGGVTEKQKTNAGSFAADYKDRATYSVGCSLCGAWRGVLGLEPTIELYVQHLVEVFCEVRRVLRDDGSLWLNLGDSYAANRGYQVKDNKHVDVGNNMSMRVPDGLKPKDLCMIPARVALALQADGWYLRSDIIWAKSNPMPESVTDRPTRSHEYVYLLTKSPRYYYDAKAVEEPAREKPRKCGRNSRAYVDRDVAHVSKQDRHGRRYAGFNERYDFENPKVTRNRRDVWTVATRPYRGAHFATFPPKLIEPCILAGCPPDGIVLDPFGGSGTTGVVAKEQGRRFVLCDLKYQDLAVERLASTPGSSPS